MEEIPNMLRSSTCRLRPFPKWRFTWSALLIAAGVCGCGDTLQSLVLRPSKEIRRTPEEFGFTYETLTLTDENGTPISAWRVPTTSETKLGTIVVVPGNDANKGRYTVGLQFFVDFGWDVILFDYQGFGESGGAATFDGLITSTRAVFKHATENDSVVAGLGISLGAPVLIRMAAEFDLAAIVMDGTVNIWEITTQWTDSHGLGNDLFGIGNAVAALSSTEDFDTVRWVAQVTEPKLFVHSMADNVAPFEGALDLYRAAPSPKHFFIVEGEHATAQFFDPGLYRNIINAWLTSIVLHDEEFTQQYLAILDEEVRATLLELGLITPEQAAGLTVSGGG